MSCIAGRVGCVEFGIQRLQIIGFHLAVIDGLVVGYLRLSKGLAEIRKADEAHPDIRFGL